MTERRWMAGVAGFALTTALVVGPATALTPCDDGGPWGPECTVAAGDVLAVKAKKAKTPPYRFDPPNPYAKKKPKSPNQVKVKQLIVVGDEESVAGGGTRVWWQWQQDRGLFRKVQSLARAGATGGDTDNDIKDQLDELLQKSKKKKKKNKPRPDRFKASKKALTVVELGLNDITSVFNTTELDTRWAFARDQLDRLKNAGATAKNRKVFLILPHDVGKQPGWDASEADALRTFSIHWAKKLSQYATPPSNGFVAVDALTFFDRVADDPTTWGLTDITDAFSGSRFDAVYSEQGQKLLGALVEHYLTQGWNWANSLDPGVSTTVPQLIDDMNRDAVDGLAFADEVNTPVFGFALGDGLPTDGLAFGEVDGPTIRGFGLGWRLAPGTGLAFVHAASEDELRYGARFGSERTRVRSGHDGIALVHRGVGYSWTARVLWSRDEIVRSRYDALSRTGVRGTTQATAIRLGQRLETSLELAGTTLTPWLGLDLGRRRVAGYAMDDPYLGRVRFGGATLDERRLTVGLGIAAPEQGLAGLGTLRLTGRLALVRDLSDRHVELRLVEGRTRRTERVALPSKDALQLGLAATLVRDAHLSLGADWGLSAGDGGTDQRIGVRFRYRFPVE